MVAIILVVAAAVGVVWWKRDTSTAGQPDWQPPPQAFLDSPMNVQPTPGWRTGVADLGLPAGSAIATSEEPYESRPIIGNLGNDAYFTAHSRGDAAVQWWLVGLDVRSGRQLFPPVPLGGGVRAPKCVLNGPGALLCVSDDAQRTTAWVIDAQTGAVIFTGPTDLRAQPGSHGIKQVGIYAVAETMGEGVRGVGPTAETTWFVPGEGTVTERLIPNTDVAPPTLATQVAGGRGSDQMVVFSVVDGAIVSPQFGDESHALAAVVYPDGFAVEATREVSRSTPDGVEFFDDAGKRLGHAEGSGFLSTRSMDVPIVESTPNSLVFSRMGEKLAEISNFGPGDVAVLIGSRLFIDAPTSDTAKQYELRTGAEGKPCDVYLGGYLATDGKVGVFEDGNPNVGIVTKAVNLDTCDTLWTLSSPVGSFRDIWRINTTLIQLSDDGTELMSLVAPR